MVQYIRRQVVCIDHTDSLQLQRLEGSMCIIVSLNNCSSM